MKTPPDLTPKSNSSAPMRRRMTVVLAIGLFCLVSGLAAIVHPVVSSLVPAVLFSIAGSSIAVFIAARGGRAIRDEMVQRAEVLSGYYTCSATLYSLFACGIANFFRPLTVSISGFILGMMIFMSWTFIAVRFYLLRKGVPE